MSIVDCQLSIVVLAGAAVFFGSACQTASDEVVAAESSKAAPGVYELSVFLPGLSKQATLRKTPLSTVYVFPDGKRVAAAEVESQERLTLRARYGSASIPFHDFLTAAPREKQVEALAIFAADLDWTRLTPDLSGEHGERRRRAALHEVREHIGAGKEAIVPVLERVGLKVKRAYRTMPALILVGRPDQFLEAARVSGLVLLQGAAPKRAEQFAAKNGVTDANIDTSFNASNYFGYGQKIGSFETEGSGVFDSHEAFALTTADPSTGNRITYQQEPLDCLGTNDCPGGLGHKACRPLGHPGHASQCVMVHETTVLSVASGSVGGVPYGAAKAQYYVANTEGSPVDSAVQCWPQGEVAAYEWFAEEGVTTVNESFGCYGIKASDPFDSGASAEGTIQDYYARAYGMTIAKASGNTAENPACPYTNNSICVGATSGSHVSCTSSYRNTNGYPGGTRTDREEPDVVAFGAEQGSCAPPGFPLVEVADPNGTTTSWTGGSGTSYAAPQIAALSALCKEALGGAADQKMIRTIMKLGAFSRNPSDYNYSTSSTNFTAPDWKDGAGAVDAPLILDFCNGTLGSTATDPGVLEGEPWPFYPDCATCGTNSPPFGGLAITPRSSGQPGTPARLYRQLDDIQLEEGYRLRYVLSWDSCPTAVDGIGAASVVTDYDLFLVREDETVMASQSVNDNNEGFDITVPAGMGGAYHVMLGFAAESQGCYGDRQEPFTTGKYILPP